MVCNVKMFLLFQNFFFSVYCFSSNISHLHRNDLLSLFFSKTLVLGMISQVDTWIHLFVFKFNFLGLLRQLLQGRILHKKVHSQFSKFCLLCVGISEPCWLVHRCAVLVDCYCVRGLRKTTHLTSHLGFEISFIFTFLFFVIIKIVMWLCSCVGSFCHHFCFQCGWNHKIIFWEIRKKYS